MSDAIKLFLGQPSPCSYLPNRESQNLVCDPDAEYNLPTHTALSEQGFRRSGDYIYRPHCSGCQACIAIRVDCHAFAPSRNQKRVLSNNADLTVTEQVEAYQQEHFDLYRAYLKSRHAGGGMEDHGADDYRQFFSSDWAETRFFEFRLGEKLLAVAVSDYLADGLSAVYCFYDPTETKRSLGTYAILWQIQQAKRMRRSWLYLGYWIEACQKMNYKVRFQPLQYWHNNQWRPHAPELNQ